MDMLKKVAVLVSCLALSACATGYHPAGATGGYSELQLDENVYKVDYSGNAYIHQETASEFALLRCAELTLEKGGKYFAIVDGRSSATQESFTSPVVSTTNISGNAYSGAASTTTYGGQTFTLTKPSISNIIVIMKERPAHGFVFDANLIAQSVKTKHRLNEAYKAAPKRCINRAACRD